MGKKKKNLYKCSLLCFFAEIFMFFFVCLFFLNSKSYWSIKTLCETENDTDLSTGITSELHFWLVFNLKNTFAELNLDISMQMELSSMSILTEKQIACWLLYFRLVLKFLMENIKM